MSIVLNGTTGITTPDLDSSDLTVTKAGTPIIADRTGSNGTILDLKKDGSAVGSIGSEGGDALYIQAGTTSGNGLLFTSNGTSIRPARNGATIHDTLDLGSDTRSFKDIYLSGGAYLGGTGSANYLSDYEEGTWSPVLRATTDPTYAAYGAGIGGYYIKIGQNVTIWFDMNVNISNAGSGDSRISGLPFQPQTSVGYGGYSTVQFRASTAFNVSAGIPLTGWVYANDSRIYPEQNHANSVSGMTYVTGVKRITGMSTYISLA